MTSTAEDLELEPTADQPNSHSETTLADDQLPAAEAFALAQEKLNAPSQPNLPGVVLPFNFQGAYLELETKAVEVDRLHDEYKAAADEAKDAKKAWDKAAELYTKMALELRRRRQAKEGEPAADLIDASERETNLVRCAFEQQHPGDACPICSDGSVSGIHPRDSVLHIDDVVGLIEMRAAVAVGDALALREIVVPLQTIRNWSPEDQAEVKAWAEFDQSSNEPMPDRPKVLGTAHGAGPVTSGEPQTCTQCDAVLIAVAEDGSEGNFYATGWLVGTDCKGKPPVRYPEKRAGRKKQQEAE